MQYDLIKTATFDRSFEKALKKFPNSVSDIKTKIKSIPNDLPGDLCTLFSPNSMKKVRFGLKEYRISKSAGLRVFYLILEAKQKIIPIYIYKKRDVKTEIIVTNNVKQNIKKILKEIKQNHSHQQNSH